jgi:outer membrane lipoprotein-sorting protein
MFKLLVGIAVTTGFVNLTNIGQAQVPSTAPKVTPQSQPNSTTPLRPASPQPSTTPTLTTPDLTLLGKVVGTFWQTNCARTESQLVMNVRDKSADIQVYATIKTLAQTGNKFRTELAFAQPGSAPTATYTIVSNGKQVWIYRPDKRQYSQTTFPKFQAESYSFLIGASSIFFLSLSEPDRQEAIAALATDRNFLAVLPKEQIKDLQGSQRQLNGENIYVYSYENKQESWGFNGFVQPQTGILKQIELTGKTDGINFSVVEKIVNRTTQIAPDSKSFRFSPPKGVKKVKSLPIDLFGG